MVFFLLNLGLTTVSFSVVYFQFHHRIFTSVTVQINALLWHSVHRNIQTQKYGFTSSNMNSWEHSALILFLNQNVCNYCCITENGYLEGVLLPIENVFLCIYVELAV